jgi:hypothetical protein
MVGKVDIIVLLSEMASSSCSPGETSAGITSAGITSAATTTAEDEEDCVEDDDKYLRM